MQRYQKRVKATSSMCVVAPFFEPTKYDTHQGKKCINRKTSLLSRQPQRSMSNIYYFFQEEFQNDMVSSQSIKLMNRVLFSSTMNLLSYYMRPVQRSYFQCYSEFPGQCTYLGGRFSGIPNVSSYLSSLFWWSQVTTLQTQNYHHAKVLLCW